MSWETRYDKNGRHHMLPEQRCDECNEVLEVLLKGDRFADSWVWRECDVCQEPICPKCSDDVNLTSLDPLAVSIVCVTCLHNPNWNKLNICGKLRELDTIPAVHRIKPWHGGPSYQEVRAKALNEILDIAEQALSNHETKTKPDAQGGIER